jgi:type II secretory pathway pseudopilin PulG
VAIRVVTAADAQRAICFLLAMLMACLPSMNLLAETSAAQAGVKPAKPAATSGKIDTTYVTSTAVVMAVLRPAQLMKSKAGEMLPVEVATAAGMTYLGINPANVEEVTFFVDPSNPMVPNYAFTLKFAGPQAALKLPNEIRGHTRPDKLNGIDYFKSQSAELPSFYQPDKNTLIIAPDATLRMLVENPQKNKSGPLIDRVQKVAAGSDLYVAFDIATTQPFIQMGLMGEELPAQVKPFAATIPLLSAAELTVNLSRPAPTELVVHANDAESADRVMSLLKEGVEKAREQLRDDLAPQRESEDPIERAFAQYMERISGEWAEPFMPMRDGARLTIFHFENSGSPQQQFVTMAVVGVGVALVLPAVQAAREAARRAQSMNNLKQIALGILNYESAKQKLPTQAICDRDGKPLLSWRVAILPYLDRRDLYNQFHLDEPWDSENNKALIAQIPAVFADPNGKLARGKTSYLALAGKECVFEGGDKVVGLRNVTDGTANTIAVVEADAGKAVEWTKPEDLKFDAKNPAAGLGHARPGGWLAMFLDGHIQAISDTMDANVVKAMVTKAGGDAVPRY